MKISRTLLGVFGLAAVLTAHPMGNFSVNHYARIEVAPGGAEILFVLDLAEIPTFELMQKWGVDRSAPKAVLEQKAAAEARAWVRQLKITVNGKPVEPKFENAELLIADGAGGLPVVRIGSHLTIASAPGTLDYHDGTYPERTAGWKEIVALAKTGASVSQTNVGSRDRSQALTAYPQDPAVAPPQELDAKLAWSAGPATQTLVTKKEEPPQPKVTHPELKFEPVPEAAPEPPPGKTASTVAEPNSLGTVKRGDFISRALGNKEIGWGLGLICAAVAFWFGALHALEPGHGKTMVAAYLVGSRGTPKHAVYLGAMVTFTHTVSVFLLGLVTLFLSRYIMPDQISKVLGVLSGITIVWIGGLLFLRRLRAFRHAAAHAKGVPHEHHHHHEHQHEHEHAHAHAHVHGPDDHHHHHHHHDHHEHGGHTHSHVPEGELSMKSLLALGASGGLVPCPSALVLLLSCISIGRAGFGMLLLLSFSLGLALVLIATGLLVLYAKKFIPERKRDSKNPVFQLLPVISAAVIVVVGAALTGNALGIIPIIRFFS